MKFGLVSSPRFQDHDTGRHVENAGRLQAIDQQLKTFPGLTHMPLRAARDEELLALHLPSHLERVEAASRDGGGWLDGDTYVSAASAEVARLAVGGCIDVALQVASGELERGFAMVRPPGHHARPDQAMGFCLYSNVALAARACHTQLGLKRVFIFDWDVHHGNGTQDCLYDCAHSCFFSIHQAPFYPGTGALEERGEGPGIGLTYNLPLHSGMRDADYLYAFDLLVVPAIRVYDPEIILLSAGYDAHREDPLGGMKLSAAGFGAMASRLAHLAETTSARGRLAAFLEGGYNPVRLAESVEATMRAWLGPGSPGELVDEDQVNPACLRKVAQAREFFQA